MIRQSYWKIYLKEHLKNCASMALSLGGLLASFGCAACCALSIVLASVGLAGAWTLHLQLLVGPYECWWLWGTIVLLTLGTVTWGRSLRRITKFGSTSAPALSYAVIPAILMLGFMLLVVTLMVEHAGWAVLL
jgi:mercuric ion transport protein